MSEPTCQLMETVEELCKRCYFLQKSNNELLDYSNDDPELNKVIIENDEIIVKYHRKIDEILETIRETNGSRTAIELSPIAEDFRRRENEEKREFSAKKKFDPAEKNDQKPEANSADDRGIFV